MVWGFVTFGVLSVVVVFAVYCELVVGLVACGGLPVGVFF